MEADDWEERPWWEFWREFDERMEAVRRAHPEIAVKWDAAVRDPISDATFYWEYLEDEARVDRYYELMSRIAAARDLTGEVYDEVVFD